MGHAHEGLPHLSEHPGTAAPHTNSDKREQVTEHTPCSSICYQVEKHANPSHVLFEKHTQGTMEALSALVHSGRSNKRHGPG